MRERATFTPLQFMAQTPMDPQPKSPQSSTVTSVQLAKYSTPPEQ